MSATIMRPADSVTLETCDSALRKSEEVPRVRNLDLCAYSFPCHMNVCRQE